MIIIFLHGIWLEIARILLYYLTIRCRLRGGGKSMNKRQKLTITAVLAAVLIVFSVMLAIKLHNREEIQLTENTDNSQNIQENGKISQEPQQIVLYSSQAEPEPVPQQEQQQAVRVYNAEDYENIMKPGIYQVPSNLSRPINSVEINCGGVMYKNATVRNIFIMNGVDSQVTLQDLTVTGGIYVYGADRVQLESVNAKNLFIRKNAGDVRINISGKTSIDLTTLNSPAQLEQVSLTGDGTGFDRMNFAQSQYTWYDVSLIGVKLREGYINTPVNINCTGKSVIDVLVVNRIANITGSGRVKNLMANSDRITYNLKLDTIYLNEKISAPIYENLPIGSQSVTGSIPASVPMTLNSPSSLTIEHVEKDGGEQLIAGWSMVPGCSGYLIEVYKDSQMTQSATLNSAQKNSYVIKNRFENEATDTSFYFTVKALGSQMANTSDSSASTSETLVKLFERGTGSRDHPYEIINGEQLESVRKNLNASYRLMSDISLKGKEFLPIGSGETPFSGILDGNGHSITDLTVTKGEYAGLFGYIGKRGSVRNLTVL